MPINKALLEKTLGPYRQKGIKGSLCKVCKEDPKTCTNRKKVKLSGKKPKECSYFLPDYSIRRISLSLSTVEIKHTKYIEKVQKKSICKDCKNKSFCKAYRVEKFLLHIVKKCIGYTK